MDETNLKAVFGENVRRFRKSHGFTQERLAELVGYGRTCKRVLRKKEREAISIVGGTTYYLRGSLSGAF